MMFKFLLIPAAALLLLGFEALVVVGIADTADDILPDWGGRGGGCHGGGGRGYYSDSDDEWGPPCHEAREDGGGEYCPYHDEYFTGAEWEEHGDECPYYDGI